MMRFLRGALMAVLLSTPALADPVDATPAFDLSVAATCASSDNRTLKYPAGTFTFITPPQPIPCALRLAGEGIGATTFVRGYSNGGFLHWTRGTDQSGGALRDLTVAAGTGTTGGIAVYVQATADTDAALNSFNRHSFLIENIIVGRVATSASWSFGLYLDGASNPDGNPNSVPGIRGVYVDKSTFGGASTASIYLNKARGTEIRGECYTPVGNGFAGVVMDNGTDSVLLQTRNCGWATWDTTGKGMMFNGTRVGPQ
jgi:hypothetical protein